MVRNTKTLNSLPYISGPRTRKRKRWSDQYRQLTDAALFRQIDAPPPNTFQYGRRIRRSPITDNLRQPEQDMEVDRVPDPASSIPRPLFRIRKGKMDLPPPNLVPSVPRFKDCVPVNLLLRRPGCVKPSFEGSSGPLAGPLTQVNSSGESEKTYQSTYVHKI
uniref:Uncharacterized protein n=1 Tax=Cacopsylla melanoneura TaxID=428564 RepID=A0A8D8W519_9HEMI